MVKAKDNLPYVTLNLEEVKSYDPAHEHAGLDHVLTVSVTSKMPLTLKHNPTLA